MTVLEALLLGLIQGLTEFLPVSSSGHLTLAQSLLGFQNLHSYIIFDLVCHLGTLVAIFILFFDPIVRVLTQEKNRALQLILATLPLFPLVLIMKPIQAAYNKPEWLGFFFWITAALLYISTKWTPRPLVQQPVRRWKDAFIIGMGQALAILPGVSRSGATISTARLCGWEWTEAVQFSFLLAIPAILGGTGYELLKMSLSSAPIPLPSISWTCYAAGFTASFLTGYFALRLLIRIAAKGKLMGFATYCFIIGTFCLLYFNFYLQGHDDGTQTATSENFSIEEIQTA